MRVSIITVVFNGEASICDSIQSVLSQGYEDIELIVIDGSSTDRTLEVIRRYNKQIDVLVSEPDDGIYDAMNKGIGLASGDIVGFLNSDDFFADESVIIRVAEEFERENVDSVFGDLTYVSAIDPARVIRTWKSSPHLLNAFRSGWHPAHPTFYAKKSVYEDYGGFDTSLSISADFELMLRFLDVHGVSSSYIPEVLVRMRTGGESNQSLRNIYLGNSQIYAAFRKHGIEVPRLYFMKRMLAKLRQFRFGQRIPGTSA